MQAERKTLKIIQRIKCKMFQQYLPITNVDCDENVVEAISHVFPAKMLIALRTRTCDVTETELQCRICCRTAQLCRTQLSAQTAALKTERRWLS